MSRRLLRILALVALAGFARPVFAECAGRDLMGDLGADVRAELDARVAEHPYAAGNRWQAVKDDSVIDIVGTYHLYDPRMAAVIDRLSATVAAADAVYLEATAAEMQALKDALMKRPELLFVGQGPTLPERLSQEEWQFLSEQMRARGIPPFMVSKFQPWYVSVMLSVPVCAIGNLGGE